MKMYDDHYARWSYEQLLLQQSHIKFGGLWRAGYAHFIICPELDTARTTEGESLSEWFDHKCRVVTAPVEIVAFCPPNVERVPERSSSDRALLAGSPRNCRDLLVDLGLSLPREFPPFTLDNPGADVVMVTNRPLTDDETEQAKLTYGSLGYYSPLQFSVDSTRNHEGGEFRYKFGQGDIDLIPSRQLTNKFSRELRYLVEKDEQFWVENRNAVLTTFHTKPSALLPSEWTSRRTLSCLVDATVFPPNNIRTYLSLYETIYLTLPLAEAFENNCAVLGVTPSELMELVKSTRVKLVLPQPVDRYPEHWLSTVAEVAPQNLLFSRRLAAATISDARRRVPLLYTPLSPVDRYTLLHILATHADELVGKEKSNQLVRLVTELGSAWAQAEWSVQSRGAMGTSHLGIGGIAASVYEHISGRDLRIELWSAAQKVEWAAALGAHAFPSSTDGYNETNACHIVAGVYGPIRRNQVVAPCSALSAVTDLLAIDSKVSAVEFAKEFSSADINRLRELVLRLARENVGQDQLADAIRKFNAEVRHYEKRPDLLKNLNVVGLFSAGAVAASAVDPSIQKFVPLAGILLGFVVNRIIDEVPRYSTAAGGIVDFLNSVLTGKANSGAVLVARARKDVASLKR
jgi:hypothetical protein